MALNISCLLFVPNLRQWRSLSLHATTCSIIENAARPLRWRHSPSVHSLHAEMITMTCSVIFHCTSNESQHVINVLMLVLIRMCDISKCDRLTRKIAFRYTIKGPIEAARQFCFLHLSVGTVRWLAAGRSEAIARVFISRCLAPFKFESL